jgi:23S rRNA (adenine2503-C2)-methyltransferase
MPCISTIAPVGTEAFFEELISIKSELYPFGFFQLQFSVHSTKTAKRDYLMPIKKWKLKEIAEYGERFFVEGDRKVAINFAVAEGFPIDVDVLAKHFDPDVFIVKLTPLNPTKVGERHKLKSLFMCEEGAKKLARSIKERGFEAIISIGELEENIIGSNCGQYLSRHLDRTNSEVRDQKTETKTGKAS